MRHRRAVRRLVAVAVVWGVSFVAVKLALRDSSPALLLGVRLALGVLPLLTLVRTADPGARRAGVVLGLLFGAGFLFQNFGLAITTPSRSAFITAMSVVGVPLFAFAVERRRPSPAVLGAVALAIGGTWLLTNPSGSGLNTGDLLTIGCALCFAGQIYFAGRFAARFAPRALLALELSVAAALALGASPLLETPRLVPTPAFLALLAFLAVSAYYTFLGQLEAQAVIGPVESALVFMLEPVAAALTSGLLLGERFTGAQLAGAGLILAGTMLPVLRPDAPRAPADEPVAPAASP